MIRLLHALATLLPVLHLVAAILYAMAFGGPRAPRPVTLRRVLLGVLLAAHGGFLVLQGSRIGHVPLSDPWLGLSALSFALVALYLPVEWYARTASTGSFVFGASFALQLVSSGMLSHQPRPSAALQEPLFALHVASGMAGFAALLLSGFYGAIYLLQLRQIRRHTFGALFRTLPDLETLSRMNRGAATLGFLMLIPGVNIGILKGHQMHESFSYLDPKVLAVLVTWLLFGVISISRWVKGLSGRRAALVALGGVSLVLLALVLSFVPIGSLRLIP